MNKKIILVTGGYGFIGSNFINYLIDNYDEFNLINIDKEGIGSNKTFIKECRTENQIIHHIKHDICNSILPEPSEFELPFDYLFHFAAESHVDRSISSPRGFIESNVMGTMQLLENARQMGVKRVIYVSSDEIYGSLKKGSAKENKKYNPSSVYSASKASAELICNAYSTTYDMDIVITRCANNFGPNQFEEKLIPKVITNAIKGEKIPVYDEGLQRREWTYVEDHITDLLFVAKHGKKGEIYNVGRGYEISNIELVKKILKILDKNEDLIEFVPNARKGHDFRYSIDLSKLNKLYKKVSKKGLDKDYIGSGRFDDDMNFVERVNEILSEQMFKEKLKETVEHYEKSIHRRG